MPPKKPKSKNIKGLTNQFSNVSVNGNINKYVTTSVFIFIFFLFHTFAFLFQIEKNSKSTDAKDDEDRR